MKLLFSPFLAFAIAISHSAWAEDSRTNKSSDHLWQRHTIDDSSKGADGVKLGDINGDGLLDLVTGWEEGNEIHVCSCTEGKSRTVYLHRYGDSEATSPSNLVHCQSWSTDHFPATKNSQSWMQASAMDIDDQNGIDLVVASKNHGGSIGWIQSPSEPLDLNQWTYQRLCDAGWIMSLHPFDIDRDGDLDIITCEERDQLGVVWYENPQIDSAADSSELRPRLAILTDIGGDPDDQQSLIRLMVYANEFEIEALIASASGTRGELKESVTRPDLIRNVVKAYGQVLPNLRRHADRWPSEDHLLNIIKSGNPLRERAAIGEGHDTEASKFLIDRIDAGTSMRPLNISIWGGQTDLCQSLWRVKQQRSAAEYAAFVAKFRVYDINDQDGVADWMRTEFPGLNYILAKAPAGRDKRLGTYRGMYLTGDESLTSRDWIQANVLSKGPLGAMYPTETYTAPNEHKCMKEGDTPAWFFFLPLGGNDPNDPTIPGWGGQFFRSPDGWYRDQSVSDDFDPRTTVSRWRTVFQADFAKRMNWCVQ